MKLQSLMTILPNFFALHSGVMGIYATGRSNANSLIIGKARFYEYSGNQGAEMEKNALFWPFFGRKMTLAAMFFIQETPKASYLSWLGPYKWEKSCLSYNNP